MTVRTAINKFHRHVKTHVLFNVVMVRRQWRSDVMRGWCGVGFIVTTALTHHQRTAQRQVFRFCVVAYYIMALQRHKPSRYPAVVYSTLMNSLAFQKSHRLVTCFCDHLLSADITGDMFDRPDSSAFSQSEYLCSARLSAFLK